MIDITGLREDKRPQSSTIVHALLDRLEAAEKSDAESLAMYRRARDERDALRAKIEQMERQEPAGTLHDDGCFVWRETAPHQSNYAGWKMALYALPGAQPAPSVPAGWLRAIDEALVVAHIGVANESDTYEQANAKLNNLIGFHVDVATDPAVNGGWKLVPSVPIGWLDEADLRALQQGNSVWLHTEDQGRMIPVCLAAAPEVKT